MANPKQDVNGLLADIERAQIIKKRALASPHFSAQQRRDIVSSQDRTITILTMKCVELGAPEGDEAGTRLPRRKKKMTNGHAKTA